ncbi:MAG: hypothetical protein AB7I32_01095 [Gammaproteobacteria bacterium]
MSSASDESLALARDMQRLPPEQFADVLAMLALAQRNPFLFDGLARRKKRGDITDVDFACEARRWLAQS